MKTLKALTLVALVCYGQVPLTARVSNADKENMLKAAEDPNTSMDQLQANLNALSKGGNKEAASKVQAVIDQRNAAAAKQAQLVADALNAINNATNFTELAAATKLAATALSGIPRGIGGSIDKNNQQVQSLLTAIDNKNAALQKDPSVTDLQTSNFAQIYHGLVG